MKVDNKKASNSKLTFKLTFTELSSFYVVVRWLNNNAGNKVTDWTTAGKVVKYLKSGKEHTVTFYIFNDNLGEESVTYLKMLAR
jgi:hypothetical protein